MSLDGLRAWIGEVERKLGVRTRVFLALTAIAIGGAGAGIYLAIDTRDNAVSEGDVQELQEQLEARIGTGGATGAGTTTEAAQLEAELDALRAEVAQLQGQGGDSGTPPAGAAGTGEGAGGAGTDAGAGDTSGGGATDGADGAE